MPPPGSSPVRVVVTDANILITWIRREFDSFPSKMAENPAFVPTIFAAVARFSQT